MLLKPTHPKGNCILKNFKTDQRRNRRQRGKDLFSSFVVPQFLVAYFYKSNSKRFPGVLSKSYGNISLLHPLFSLIKGGGERQR